MNVEQLANTELRQAEDDLFHEILKRRAISLSQVSFLRGYHDKDIRKLELARDSLIQQELIEPVARHADWSADWDPLYRCYQANLGSFGEDTRNLYKGLMSLVKRVIGYFRK